MVQTLYDDNYYLTLHFDFSLNDFDIHSRWQECKKTKMFCANYSKFSMDFNGIGVLLKLVGLMNLILFGTINVQAYLDNFMKQI